MSMGYMPKKVKYAKRQQRMKKKYKNFSCKTCEHHSWCKHKIIPTPPIGMVVVKGNIEFCPHWKAEKKQKVVTSHTDVKNRKSLKTILKNIL
jgi:hypothetical protein